MVLRTYNYRIYPTKNQRIKLEGMLEELRWTYNYFLEQRKSAWEKEKKNISHYDQMKLLPAMKAERPSLDQVYSQSLQDIPCRIDLAFNAFFRRVKAGQTPGYPRFKSKDRFNSFKYPQTNLGFKITSDSKIKLSKIGSVKIKLHRTPPSIIKNCVVKRTGSGKWFVSLVGETLAKRLEPNASIVALDMGIKCFATLHDGTHIDNPKYTKKSSEKLAKAQRELAHLEKGTPKRHKQKRNVIRIHEKIKNQRHNFTHEISRQLVNKYHIIAVEDIQVNRMFSNENPKVFNRCLQDVAWSQFFSCLTYKAEEAGRTLVKVNPAYTSQDCSRCGTRKLMPLENRVYHCDVCGLELDRDHNAALNIKRLATQSLERCS